MQQFSTATHLLLNVCSFKFKTKGLLKNARDAVRRKRLDAGELEWKQQIAACTIQLAWRKYARRRLLEKLQKNGSLAIHMWDPEMLALRQRRMLELIYGERNLINWYITDL